MTLGNNEEGLRTPGGEVFTQRFVSSVDSERCVGCGNCAFSCPRGTFQIVSSDARVTSGIVKRENCVGCSACLRVCPTKAIKLRTEEPKSFPTEDKRGYSQGRIQAGMPFLQSFVQEVDETKCVGCGKCAWVCSRNCYRMVLKNGKSVADPAFKENCIGDGACTRACPTRAIH